MQWHWQSCCCAAKRRWQQKRGNCGSGIAAALASTARDGLQRTKNVKKQSTSHNWCQQASASNGNSSNVTMVAALQQLLPHC